MTATPIATPLRSTIPTRDLRRVWNTLPRDSTGAVSVRAAAEFLGATYLAVAERASDECYRGRAALFGPSADTRFVIKP
jgi:hypothetical protein